MKKVRFGIIGFGGFAESTIAPAMRLCSNTELVAIQKRSPELARQKASEFNIPHAFSSVEDLVAHPDVDAVFIVSANGCHHAETLAAAGAGKHVLVEKPMAMNVREAREMIGACKSANVKLMVGHMIRYSTAMRHVRELVRSGSLGTITFARADFVYDARLTKRGWLFDRKVAGGGPVFDIGVHCLDTLRFVLDDDVASVRSHLRPTPTDSVTESTASISLRFGKGTPGSIYCSFETHVRRSFIEIIGTEGTVSAENFTLGDRTITLTIGTRTRESGPAIHNEEVVVPNLYVEEITDFSRAILENGEPLIAAAVGLENQRVIDAVMKETDLSRD